MLIALRTAPRLRLPSPGPSGLFILDNPTSQAIKVVLRVSLLLEEAVVNQGEVEASSSIEVVAKEVLRTGLQPGRSVVPFLLPVEGLGLAGSCSSSLNQRFWRKYWISVTLADCSGPEDRALAERKVALQLEASHTEGESMMLRRVLGRSQGGDQWKMKMSLSSNLLKKSEKCGISLEVDRIGDSLPSSELDLLININLQAEFQNEEVPESRICDLKVIKSTKKSWKLPKNQKKVLIKIKVPFKFSGNHPGDSEPLNRDSCLKLGHQLELVVSKYQEIGRNKARFIFPILRNLSTTADPTGLYHEQNQEVLSLKVHPQYQARPITIFELGSSISVYTPDYPIKNDTQLGKEVSSPHSPEGESNEGYDPFSESMTISMISSHMNSRTLVEGANFTMDETDLSEGTTTTTTTTMDQNRLSLQLNLQENQPGECGQPPPLGNLLGLQEGGPIDWQEPGQILSNFEDG